MTFEAGPYLAAEVDDAVFLVHRDSGESYRIGGSGTRTWTLLCSGATLSEAIRTIAEETDADVDSVTDDVTRFAADLEAIGALRRVTDDDT